jgi:hypothetical protein
VISFWLNQNIDDGSILVHGPPQVVVDTIHLNEHFVQPHNVGDPVNSGVISIKSMEVLPVRADIGVGCRIVTRRRREIESSIR